MYDLPITNLSAALAQIDKANARLARTSIAERFTYELEPYVRTRTSAFGIETGEDRVRLTLSAPEIGFEGWVFVARLVEEEAGYIAFCAPGQNLDGWTRPDTAHCDYCGKSRRRSKIYILRNTATGEIKQVGASCIVLFLGVKVSGLWTLEFDLDELPETGDDWVGGIVGAVDQSLHNLDALALALAFSERGRGYISRARAENTGHTATVETIRTAIWGLNYVRDPERRSILLSGIDEAKKIRAQEPELLDAVKAAAESLDNSSDYGMNMHTLLGGEYISAKSLGIFVSLVAVYARQQQFDAERATVAPGFVADVKARIEDVAATVTVSRVIPGAYGPKTRLVMRTDDDHLLTWLATGSRNETPGMRVRILRATVKAHETYRDQDQTVLTRAKLEPAA